MPTSVESQRQAIFAFFAVMKEEMEPVVVKAAFAEMGFKAVPVDAAQGIGADTLRRWIADFEQGIARMTQRQRKLAETSLAQMRDALTTAGVVVPGHQTFCTEKSKP